MHATEKIKRYFNQNNYPLNVKNLINDLLAEELMKEQEIIFETNAYQKLLDFSNTNKIEAQKYIANPFSTFVLIKEITGGDDKKILEMMKNKIYIFAKEYSSEYEYISDLFNISKNLQKELSKELVAIKYNKRMEKSTLLNNYFMNLKNTPSTVKTHIEKENGKPSLRVLVDAQTQDVKNNKELENIKKAIEEKGYDHFTFDELMIKTHPHTQKLYCAYINIGITDINLLFLLLQNSSSQRAYAIAKLGKKKTKTPVENYIMAEKLKVDIDLINEIATPKNEEIVKQLKEINAKYYVQRIESIQKYLPKKEFANVENNVNIENNDEKSM